MVAPHDLCQNPLFSHKMICKQYIILNHVFFWYKSNLKPVTYSPFWLNIVLNVPKLKITQTHIPHNNTSQIIFFVLFTFSVRVNNPWPKQFVLFVCFFFNVRNCHLVSLIVLVLQWILRWSKRVSLRSVSSTNYPTLHHPQLSIFFFFTCLEILCITKYYNIQNQIHTTFTHVLTYKTQKWSKIH